MILFLSNADTELLAARSIVDDLPPESGGLRWANPDRLDEAPPLEGVGAVIIRLLGGARAWEGPFEALLADAAARRVPVIAVGGEATPDADLAALSTVPAGVVAEAHRYLVAGGPANTEQLVRFVSDTCLLTGVGFDAPVELPRTGVWDRVGLGRPDTARRPERPLVAVVFYRAHLVAGNTTYVEDLCAALDAAGADALAVYTYSLRVDAEGEVPALATCAEHGVDAVITSIFAAGATAGEDGDQWEVPMLADLDVPVIQAPASSRSAAIWRDDEAGLSPVDVGMGVAIPEFDGRIIGPTFAFKEIVDDGADQITGGAGEGAAAGALQARALQAGGEIVATRTVAERTERLAALAVRHARLRHVSPPEKKVVLVLSAYPTKRSRIGNAVGLDTPASAVETLHALAASGYRVDRIPADGDALMAELADTLTYDLPTLDEAQLAAAPGRLDAEAYTRWFASLPIEAQKEVTELWGPAPGEVYHHDGSLVFPGMDLGGVLVTIQPPRGFGSDPIGTYHAPDMPPPHHYLAFYRWLAAPTSEGGWGADAAVHLGKHGTLEWLPGKALALSGGCFPDAALADLPFAYPFVVNDPGEGTQAKRRTHAVVVDHLPPPLTRADTYDDVARLEQLLDAYAQMEAMDPGKLPAIRTQVWELLVSTEIHRDLDLGDAAPTDDDFDDMILHVDGYLCALKDAQIRGGLHLLGRGPEGEQLIETALAVTRLPQASVPALRATVAAELGVDLDAGVRTEIDAVEAECRARVEALAATGWDASSTDDPTLRWLATRLIPNLEQTTDEITNLLRFLDGRYVPAGPSGAPSRGGAHVLPTGRNFYSVDPKAIPSPLAWEVGSTLADRLVAKHVDETGVAPSTVGLVLWGTAAMRTTGDDAAEALALLGVRPVWNDESGRVTGLEVIPLEELGRPRVDVTLRISGFFRDAFPHVIALLDDAVAMVATLDEPAADNPIAATGNADARIYGPPPGGYGSGILPVLESKNWRSDADLAEVYLAWSGFAYGRERFGTAEPEAMRRRFAAIEVAVKNQDNREHDIFDSDDYLQDHGGMVAAVRALTGKEPKAWFGDSADPANPKVRTLAEEAARVVRSRVINPKWIAAMQQHGYKGAFELAATVDYLFGYDATAKVVEDWMYERVTEAYVADAAMRKFFEESNPWALRSIAERLLEADQRDMWNATPEARQALEQAVLEAEGWEETR
ncbi:MAG: cobaltochelatase subunit CobN [Actinomycetota bacterium]